MIPGFNFAGSGATVAAWIRRGPLAANPLPIPGPKINRDKSMQFLELLRMYVNQ